MADVRALLRAERANRRVTHPQASYTKDKLLCNLCDLPIKSEAAWQSHLHSTGHTLRLNRMQEVEVTRKTESESGSKKRKAETLDSPAPDERKKARPTIDEEDAVDLHVKAPTIGMPSSTAIAEVFDDEYAAFEREMAELDSAPAVPSALYAAATISAAPMSAADVAAQAREEQSAQRGRRDAEIEDEREDAVRLLEDELNEMEGLEERVRKLRERRDLLKHRSRQASKGGELGGETVIATENPHDETINDDDADDEEDDEDPDEWNFGGG